MKIFPRRKCPDLRYCMAHSELFSCADVLHLYVTCTTATGGMRPCQRELPTARVSVPAQSHGEGRGKEATGPAGEGEDQ